MDSNGILIWNVRGLNDRAKRDSIKSLVLDTMPSIAWRDRSISTGVSVIKEFRVSSILVDVRSTLVVHRCVWASSG
jgi:hypothetical protein